MLATKTCPSCGEDVPNVARRCKSCFHDFTVVKPPNNGPLILLTIVALMATIGAGVTGAITTFPTSENILIDQDSQSIKFVRQYSVGGPVTETLTFSTVASLEHIIESNGKFRVIAIRNDGERVELSVSDKSQKSVTEQYAVVMNKPWIEVNNTTGFFKEALDQAEKQGH